MRILLEGAGYESIAICFLNSYANPAHERRSALRVNRRTLREEGERRGPLLIGDDTSTAYVPPAWRARVDSHHNVILTRHGCVRRARGGGSGFLP